METTRSQQSYKYLDLEDNEDWLGNKQLAELAVLSRLSDGRRAPHFAKSFELEINIQLW